MKTKFIFEKADDKLDESGKIDRRFLVSRTNSISAIVSLCATKILMSNPKKITGKKSAYDKIVEYNKRGIVYITEGLEQDIIKILLEESKNTLGLTLEQEETAFVRKSTSSTNGWTKVIAHKAVLTHISPVDQQKE